MNDHPNVAVIYYSATGNVHRLAEAVGAGARNGGADVRLRQVPELAPASAIAANPAWRAHRHHTRHVPTATLDDLRWADAVLLGSPTRFGLPAAQMKQFIDQTGGMWFRNELENKVYASFTSAGTAHGGVEATTLALNNTFYHWGGIIVPPGYTAEAHHDAGNPYGASHVAVNGAPPADRQLLAAQHLGHRAASVAVATSALRETPLHTMAGFRSPQRQAM